MVGHAEDVVGPKTLQTTGTQPVEGLRTGHFVGIKTVDVKLVGTVGHVLHHMGVPYFIKKRIHKIGITLRRIISCPFSRSDAYLTTKRTKLKAATTNEMQAMEMPVRFMPMR